MTERWLPVVGYESFYEVSDQGRVRSLKTGRLLKNGTSATQSHPRVRLSYKGSDLRLVHRLVLESFVGICPPGMEGCHYNDIETDNQLSNLRWDTRSGNRYDRVRNGRDHNARRGCCKNGHEFTPDNTYLRADGGGRACRACDREKTARHRSRLKAA